MREVILQIFVKSNLVQLCHIFALFGVLEPIGVDLCSIWGLSFFIIFMTRV